jgi:desulfoferrodoxin-like iron-binding protein
MQNMVIVNDVREICHCEICVNVAEVIEVGKGELACFGEPMVLEADE